jgi:hypothetical protein
MFVHPLFFVVDIALTAFDILCQIKFQQSVN